MEFTIKHNEKQYTDSEIREVIDKYNDTKRRMRVYTLKRYNKYKEDLNSEDAEIKGKAEAFMSKQRQNALNYYKNHTNDYYQNNQLLHKCRNRYNYYRRNNRIEEFVKNEKFKETIEILKNDNTRTPAKEKYPLLFNENE
jgi:hypothetical protein